jgi:hypothetical protein
MFQSYLDRLKNSSRECRVLVEELTLDSRLQRTSDKHSEAFESRVLVEDLTLDSRLQKTSDRRSKALFVLVCLLVKNLY